MRLTQILPLIETTRAFETKIIDPALLTADEYLAYTNRSDKHHPSGAYDWSMADMNQTWKDDPKVYYPRLLQQMVVRGVRFQIRVRDEDRWLGRYPKKTPDGEILRAPDGEVMMMSPEEVRATIRRRWDRSFAIVDPRGKVVGIAEDEWGAMLISVAREYRGWGFGTILGKIARTETPEKDSGGFTSAGGRNLLRVHREFVRDYLSSGFYSYLVRTGVITAERAKAIIASARLDVKKRDDKMDLSNKPEDWLIYVGEYDDFIIYNKKLPELYKLGDEYEHWQEEMLVGMIYASADTHHRAQTIHAFGGTTDAMKSFLLRCALTAASKDQMGIHIPIEYERLVKLPGVHIEPGIQGETVIAKLVANPLDYQALGAAERRFRKSFDRYDEFKSQMAEAAYAKFRDFRDE